MTDAGYGYEEEITLLEKLLLEKITIWGEEGFYAYLEVKERRELGSAYAGGRRRGQAYLYYKYYHRPN